MDKGLAVVVVMGGMGMGWGWDNDGWMDGNGNGTWVDGGTDGRLNEWEQRETQTSLSRFHVAVAAAAANKGRQTEHARNDYDGWRRLLR